MAQQAIAPPQVDRAPAAPGPALLGSVDAFNSLVREHQDVAYSVAYRLLGSREAAQDATQEAFLRAYRARGQFHYGNARSWLLRIVSNVAIDELRRRKRRPQLPFATLLREDEVDCPAYDPPDPSPDPEAWVLHRDLRVELDAALARLSDDLRLVVILRDIYGLSYQEIASHAGVSIGTVGSRLSRGRGQLRAILQASAEPRPSCRS
jgi:RNA polymerase sigma-70 factor, ECF subfamily